MPQDSPVLSLRNYPPTAAFGPLPQPHAIVGHHPPHPYRRRAGTP